MATAAFVMGPRDGMALLEKTRDVDGIIIDDRGNKHVTSGLRDKVIWKR
jgi:thiamine biosynthesis lipoprotein ApbE